MKDNEWRILHHQWSQACQSWHDDTQRRFEHEFWREFEKMVPAYIRKLEETQEVIRKADMELD